MVATTPYHNKLPATVIDLLRTPILLDIFWRTFVEAETLDVSRASQLQTRHNLLSAFWQERLLNSARNAHIRDKLARLAGVFSRLAGSISPIPEFDLDSETVELLLSEGILVREGQLQSHLRFRHPLIRDFAFAQWCLATVSTSEMVQRWEAIQGGLQRHGALRAIFEALSDLHAQEDYPTLSLGGVVQAIVRADEAFVFQLAQVLGTREPSLELDPAGWPSDLQTSLPPEFGQALLSTARFEENPSWARPIQDWPDNAAWLNKDYPKEVLEYVVFLFERLRSEPHEARLREHCRQGARKLRQLTEAPRFACVFNESDRLLKMRAMHCVIPVLPDEATLVWVENEMGQSSWQTRSYALEQLIHLAPISPGRTAQIYRRAVCLSVDQGRPRLDTSQWRGVMEHQAIDWSLAGAEGRRSLSTASRLGHRLVDTCLHLRS